MCGHKPTDLTKGDIMITDLADFVDFLGALSDIFGGAGSFLDGLSFFS
ncbi:hypothetical protein A3Q40_02823 [Rhodococcus sp. PBTS 1]|nr:hypothetical protein A3Q40_02823 [Rhodococcus sp. PBTS 1]